MYTWKNQLKTPDFWFQSENAHSSFSHKDSPLSTFILEAAIAHQLAMLFPALNEFKDHSDPSKVHNSELLIHILS